MLMGGLCRRHHDNYVLILMSENLGEYTLIGDSMFRMLMQVS